MVAVYANAFFLSEILRRKVYIKTERVGRLDDFVIVETGRLPEVSHLVVTRPYGYPSLLVPWERVSLISNTEIVIDAPDAAGLEQPVPENAILLKAHVLDKKILDMDDHEVEIVYDIKLAVQNGKLYASEVDFSRGRLLRRFGLGRIADFFAQHDEDRATVSWLYVQPLPEKLGPFSGHVKLSVLKDKIQDIHPVDLADILEELDADQRLAVFNELDPELASDTLEEVEPRVQRELIGSMKLERAAQLINDMSPAQAADLLAILPGSEADELLKLMDQESASKVQQIVDKHGENILLYATQDYIKQSPGTLVGELVKGFRQLARGKEVIMYVYVAGPDDVLRGVLDIRELIAADNDRTLADIMTDHVITLGREDTLRDATEMFERYGFRAIPVTDAQDRLLGVVRDKNIRGIKPRLD